MITALIICISIVVWFFQQVIWGILLNYADIQSDIVSWVISVIAYISFTVAIVIAAILAIQHFTS
jgi:hypothetical protein